MRKIKDKENVINNTEGGRDSRRASGRGRF